jgi:predicted nucleic acid-binding protein
MGLSSVLDTNVLIHKLHGELEGAVPAQGALISVITEIELLGFSGMTPTEEANVRALISTLTVIPLFEGIKDETIRLRRTLRLRLPDAIVLATAVVTRSELLTNDLDLVAKSSSIVPCRSLALKARV